jgi:hypothetical protein
MAMYQRVKNAVAVLWPGIDYDEQIVLLTRHPTIKIHHRTLGLITLDLKIPSFDPEIALALSSPLPDGRHFLAVKIPETEMEIE